MNPDLLTQYPTLLTQDWQLLSKMLTKYPIFYTTDYDSRIQRLMFYEFVEIVEQVTSKSSDFKLTNLGRNIACHLPDYDEIRPIRAVSEVENVNPDLSWLLDEGDVQFNEANPLPKKPRYYKLNEAQITALERIYGLGNWSNLSPVRTTGVKENRFAERLAKRGLIEKCNSWVEDRKHSIEWKLTNFGRSVCSGLFDLPF